MSKTLQESKPLINLTKASDCYLWQYRSGTRGFHLPSCHLVHTSAFSATSPTYLTCSRKRFEAKLRRD